ncbi:MAG TPA: serine/threonine-protein kinase, partial [Planctomycetota bacterium]|nr:serine/threonine-protein kinase [Planctomycetota bacterium]
MKPNLEAFRMLAEVGSGAHGTVHRAVTLTRVFDLEAGSEVAVKFLRRELIEDEAFQRRFRREAEIGMEVRHENVVRFHGLLDGSLFGLPYLALVMDFVHGRTLRALLDSQGPPLEALVLRVGRDAAAGLAALHQKNIVHRDIKPENLYLADDGSTKIVDLGYADVIARGRRSSLAGTLSYAAPELLRGAAATPQSDLYALALTLFELAAGRLPFDETSDVDALLDERLHSAPRRLSALRPRTSPFFDTLLDEMLRIDAERRPFDALDFARVLEGGAESSWWRLRRRTEPVLASKQRVRATRRPAPTKLFGRDREVARL